MSTWSLRWHFTNKSVTGAPYSIKSYSPSRSWTLRWRVRWLKQCRLEVAAELQQRWRRTNRRREEHSTQTTPPVLPPGGYFKHTSSFSCRCMHRDIMCKHAVINIQHAYYGLRLWLQEVVPSVRCLHRVFLPAKLKAACAWASLPQPGGNVEQPISLCANMTSSTKPEIRN